MPTGAGIASARAHRRRGATSRSLPALPAGPRRLDGLPHALRCGRHLDVLDAELRERVDDGVDDRAQRRRGATLAATAEAVTACLWRGDALRRLGPAAKEAGAFTALLEEAEGQLREYFRGERRRFDLPLRPQGTAFQLRIWAELAAIPYGTTLSYGELAKRAGNPGAVRAAGTANGRNPLCILIPCHRVVRGTGELGGFAGGVENKAFLLALEGGKPDKGR